MSLTSYHNDVAAQGLGTTTTPPHLLLLRMSPHLLDLIWPPRQLTLGLKVCQYLRTELLQNCTTAHLTASDREH